jgi:hypothetical protein
MDKALRIVVTVAAFFVALFFLGLLAMTGERGTIAGILGPLIIFGIPSLVWWATGRMKVTTQPEKPWE